MAAGGGVDGATTAASASVSETSVLPASAHAVVPPVTLRVVTPCVARNSSAFFTVTEVG